MTELENPSHPKVWVLCGLPDLEVRLLGAQDTCTNGGVGGKKKAAIGTD